MKPHLVVLSLFPGIGLLDMAFEEEGFTVVRGPDLLWGGDIRRFHVPPGKFDGVIGGPPCQHWSRLRHMVARRYGPEKVAPDLIPEFARVVTEAQPAWFLMENVPEAPAPSAPGYEIQSIMLNNRWTIEMPEQNRLRHFYFGTKDGRRLHFEVCIFENPKWEPACLASGGTAGPKRKPKPGQPSNWRMGNAGNKTMAYFREARDLQGLPDGFLDDAPFTVAGKVKVVGNGVPLPMGREVVRAIKRALEVL